MRNTTVILNEQANNIVMLADDMSYVLVEALQTISSFFYRIFNHINPNDIVAGVSLLLVLLFVYLLSSSLHIR